MTTAEKLAELIGRLKKGEGEALQGEIQEFFSQLDAEELVRAEQELVQAGLDPADIKQLCPAHQKTASGEAEKLRKSLEPGHMIHTFLEEHDMILSFLEELVQVNQKIQKMSSLPDGGAEIAKIMHVADHLIGAEPHHQREEEVLFPEMEERGLTGPPGVMRMEHVELRKLKHQLKEIADCAGKEEFHELKQKLDVTAINLVQMLRDHIYKENNILFPMALQAIPQAEKWQEMKDRCDRIGYCCFSPKK